jgi:hypothetical protein
MKAYYIAIYGQPKIPWYMTTDPHSILQDFIKFVQETDDKTIKGLVSIMAEELQHHRLDGMNYMGSNSTEFTECAKDSEFLLARYLLECSSEGAPPGYVGAQLSNSAWNIHTKEGGTDWIKNWVTAERRYVRNGLEYLAQLQQQHQAGKEKTT